MAKLTKNQLKSIVKECLVEILSEGLATSSDIVLKTRSQTSKKRTLKDSGPKRNIRNSENFNKAAERKAASLTSDPIMQSILADTARTTLQEQAQADKRAGVNVSETAQPGKNIEDIPIFAEGSQNWAALAFSEKKRL